MSKEYKFSQCFGDKSEIEEVSETDIISAVEFSGTGDYLATGDRGGRVVLFEKSGKEYKFYTEFVSHEPEFDYLKSLEIEEKINKIKWLNYKSNSHCILTSNDKTIKLFKVYEKQLKQIQRLKNTKIPQIYVSDTIIHTQQKKVFANAHSYHINSVSVNSDSETFLSSDDLRINLWNLNVSTESFNIVDIKPTNMEELQEVITCTECHPIHCNLFMWSSSRGVIKLADMRTNALCDSSYAKQFEVQEDASQKTFFTEIIQAISDVKFSRCGRYILSRDYLTLKVWDINNESKPIKTINVHEHIKGKLCDLYENDCIFDKFECYFNPSDSSQVVSGTYSNHLSLYSNMFADKPEQATLHADKSVFKQKNLKPSKKGFSSDGIDFNKKILHYSWHPTGGTIAIAATNNLFIFNQQ